MNAALKYAGIVTGLLATLIAILIGIHLATLWVLHDYNPDFLKIDSCIDAGGTWNYETRECENPRSALSN